MVNNKTHQARKPELCSSMLVHHWLLKGEILRPRGWFEGGVKSHGREEGSEEATWRTLWRPPACIICFPTSKIQSSEACVWNVPKVEGTGKHSDSEQIKKQEL
jgi:hypothetical protein